MPGAIGQIGRMIGRVGHSAPPKGGMAPLAFLGNRLAFYITGKRAEVSSGPVSNLPSLGRASPFAAVGSARPTVASSVLTFDGVNDYMTPAIGTATLGAVPMTAAVDVPSASGSGPNGGFTNTGLSRIGSTGTYAKCWIVGNDGRQLQDDASPYLSSVVLLSPDKTTKVAEVTAASLGITPAGSIQGVVYLPGLHQIAFAHLGTGQVYFLNADTLALIGPMAGGAISGLNGLAYDPDRDCLITSTVNSTAAIWRKRTTGAAQFAVSITIDADHLFWHVGRQSLFYTTGDSVGAVRERGLGQPWDNLVYTLTGADAVEGLWNDGVSTVFDFCNDAGYHSPGRPIPKNRILTFELGALPTAYVGGPVGSTVQIFGVLRVPVAAATSARVIAGIGNSAGANGGVALYLPSGATTQLRVLANSATATWTTPALTTARRVFVSINLAADTAELWIDGASLGSQSLSVATTCDLNDPRPPYIGAEIGGASRWFPGEITSIGVTVDSANDRVAIEAFLVADAP